MTIIDRPSDLNELTLVESAITVITGSENAQDMCKRLVHADFAQGGIKGAHLYSIDSRSTLVELSGYGLPFAEPGTELSIWDDHPISQCVRSKRLVSNNGEQSTLVCLPFIANGVPIGALVIVCDPGVNIPAIREDVVPLLSKIGGYFLNTSGGNLTPTANHNSGNVTLEEITTRQIQILGLMGDGLTNAEIAGRVLLSESTVRQETIRIYRTLKCHNRAEAIVKARANGIIPEISAVQ